MRGDVCLLGDLLATGQNSLPLSRQVEHTADGIFSGSG
jgi:predicted RecA/RadA family phage recombinase